MHYFLLLYLHPIMLSKRVLLSYLFSYTIILVITVIVHYSAYIHYFCLYILFFCWITKPFNYALAPYSIY